MTKLIAFMIATAILTGTLLNTIEIEKRPAINHAANAQLQTLR